MYLLGPEAGIPATAALMASHTYADTGSAKAALTRVGQRDMLCLMWAGMVEMHW